MTDAERPLDAIDRKIIALLTADGRMSINELANQVSISRASAYSRVERLRTSGVIEGFVTPSGLPTWARIAIGIAAELLFLLYVYVLGGRAARSGDTGDLDPTDRSAELPTAA